MSNVASIIEPMQDGYRAQYGEKMKVFNDVRDAAKWLESCKYSGVPPIDDSKYTFLRRFGDLIDSKPIKRIEIARRIGITPAQISKYTANRVPNVEMFMALAKGADLSDKEIMYCLKAFWGE